MKYLFYAATFLLPLLSVAQTEAKIIEADIRGRGCLGGLGLCTIQAPQETISGKTNTTPKTSIKLVSPNVFFLEIDKKQLSESEQKSIAGKLLTLVSEKESLSFVQEVDLIIDEKTLIYLGIDPKYNLLKAGNYPLTIISEKISVSFTLTYND
jgi:hypothetical protein